MAKFFQEFLALVEDELGSAMSVELLEEGNWDKFEEVANGWVASGQRQLLE